MGLVGDKTEYKGKSRTASAGFEPATKQKVCIEGGHLTHYATSR